MMGAVGTLTTGEVAALLDVEPATVWQWVARGHLRPVRPGAKPLRFREVDVIDLEHERRPAPEKHRLDTLARGWLASSSTTCQDSA